MLFKAIEFAAKAHSGQFRKATNIPYIIHPLGVAKILIECGCSEEIVVAGVLHDTVEDTPATLDQIRTEFGEQVAKLVQGASEPNKKDIWENRKRQFIESLKTASQDVLMVVIADKLDNIRSIRDDYAKMDEELWSHFSRPKVKQRWYFQSLVEVFANRLNREPGVSLLKEFQKEAEEVFTP
ncbi:HD domain-containing protein [candidate division KSB1 bacterium]|nr:HD domain-containing protein [candidate division KSB1 bacterium]NIR69524.1 HD domain-containing protein [candidate division KSB1 bacterium]NIS24292.1 HD domain-containing protein [candidate division KSB1 bacterium]NIT71207.1 HD domain-containing protein [candidate division KSB1 bacterium]NIU24911.1 HD domain-containing protein [candidate division KSB1 bacterium]